MSEIEELYENFPTILKEKLRNKEIIEFNMKFPNPHKKMAAGYVHCEGGPQETKDEHVCWWLYKDVDLSSFRIMEDKNE